MIAMCSATQFANKGSKKWEKYDYDKEAKLQGYDKLIVKPIPIEELGSIIKVYLGAK